MPDEKEKDEKEISLLGDGKSVEIEPDRSWESLSDTEKIAIFNEWRTLADKAHEPWLRQAERSYEYMESNQIPPDLRNRDPEILYLCLNMIRNRVGTKAGILTTERPVPHLEGEDLSDETGAAAFEHVFNFTARDKDTRIDVKNRACARDMLICGLGVLREEKNPDRPIIGEMGQPVGFGDVRARRVDPLKIRIDPAFKLNDPDSIRYIIELKEVPVRDLRLRYGNKVAQIKGEEPLRANPNIRGLQYAVRRQDDSVDSRGPLTSQGFAGGSGGTGFSNIATVEVISYLITEEVTAAWEKRYQNPETQEGEFFEEISLDSGQPIPAEEIISETNPTGKYRVIKKLRHTCRIATKVEDILLDDREDEDFDELPFALYLGEEVHGNSLPVGDVYHLLHPQDLMNSIITAVTDNAIRNNNAGWKYEKNALSPREKERLRKFGNSPGFSLEVENGYLDRVQRIEPGRISDALYQIWNDLRVLFDELAATYQIQRGGMPYETSGRGIIALLQSADTSSAGWHIAIEDALTRWGRLRIRNIQKNYRFERVLRITEEFAGSKVVRLVQTPQGLSVQDMTGETLLKDLSVAKYDITITVSRGTAETEQEKMDKGKFLYEAGVVDEEYLAKAFNVKNASEVVRRTKERDRMRQLGEQFMRAAQQAPQLQVLLQNPSLLLELERAAQVGVEDLATVAPAFAPAAGTQSPAPANGRGMSVMPPNAPPQGPMQGPMP